MTRNGGQADVAVERRPWQTSSPTHARRSWAVLALVGLVLVSATGCSLSRDVTKSQRTAIEQLLLTQAVERSLEDLSIPLPDGVTVTLDTAALTGDHEFVQKTLADRLNRQGFHIPQKPEEATYRARVIIQALGTEQGTSFVGVPPVQSMLIPFALPELALYKNVHQQGLVRWSLDVYEIKTGRYISSSPWYKATTFYRQYTVLMFFSFVSTDISLPQ